MLCMPGQWGADRVCRPRWNSEENLTSVINNPMFQISWVEMAGFEPDHDLLPRAPLDGPDADAVQKERQHNWERLYQKVKLLLNLQAAV